MLTVHPGLAGDVVFDSQIAEPNRNGGSLRYRGIDIEKLVGNVSFGDVWGLLVDGNFNEGLPADEPYPLHIHSGNIRVDVQAAIPILGTILGPAGANRHRRATDPSGPPRVRPLWRFPS